MIEQAVVINDASLSQFSAKDFAWQKKAKCKKINTSVFFPVPGRGRNAKVDFNRKQDVAKVICSTCPVREACLDFAVRTGEEHGVWGGLDQEERQRVRRVERLNSLYASAGLDAPDLPDALYSPQSFITSSPVQAGPSSEKVVYRRRPPEELEMVRLSVRELKESGLSTRQIAQALGVSEDYVRRTVTYLIKNNELQRRGRSTRLVESIDSRVEELRKSGKAIKEIAGELGVAESQVRRACDRLLQTQKTQKREHQKIKREKIDKQVLDIRSQGVLSNDETAEKLGISLATLEASIGRLIAKRLISSRRGVKKSSWQKVSS